jgi:Flp pilus assembly protein TadB
MSALAVLAAVASAVAVGLVLRVTVPTPKRLRQRIDPYLAPKLVTVSSRSSIGALRSVFGPIAEDLADWVGARIDRAGSGVMLVRLRQAGWYREVPEEDRLGAFRMTQLRALLLGAVIALVVGHLLDASLVLRLALLGLGVLVGGTRTRGQLERAIENRRERMKIEIYTVNQLLAMRVRAGGGVVNAVHSIVDRGTGEVVGELEEALRLHRSGWRGPDAFRRIAELTPEPFCSRTYRLLASAEERGADLAGALLSLSEDVRETRRESIKRTATKRRAAMLVPTIAILAPVLILFVAAPLPYLITGWQ